MKKYNLSKKILYEKNGEQKSYWANVGTMTQFDNGNMVVEIPAIGLTANVFPEKPFEKTKIMQETNDELTIEYPEEEINPDEIPF